jgi:hypothetical protein
MLVYYKNMKNKNVASGKYYFPLHRSVSYYRACGRPLRVGQTTKPFRRFERCVPYSLRRSVSFFAPSYYFYTAVIFITVKVVIFSSCKWFTSRFTLIGRRSPVAQCFRPSGEKTILSNSSGAARSSCKSLRTDLSGNAIQISNGFCPSIERAIWFSEVTKA